MVPPRAHILVVDDLVDMAESTAELLTLWGYEATACSSGAAALERSVVQRPAAVLLDLMMPRMDGFAFAQEFRRLRGCEAVPLIALSGYASPECFLRARRAGVDHFLLKPVAPKHLRQFLLSLTGGTAAVPAPRPGARRRSRGRWAQGDLLSV